MLPHINYEQKTAKESKLQPSQVLPTIALYRSWANKSSYGCARHQYVFSLFILENIKIQLSITEAMVVYKCTWKIGCSQVGFTFMPRLWHFLDSEAYLESYVFKVDIGINNDTIGGYFL